MEKVKELEKEFTRVPNAVMWRLYTAPLSGREFRVLLFIIYQTYGYNHAERGLSNSYIANGTGIAKHHVSEILKKFMGQGIISKTAAQGRVPQVISLNVRVDEWRVPKNGNVTKNGNIPKNGNVTIPENGNQYNTDKYNTECVGAILAPSHTNDFFTMLNNEMREMRDKNDTYESQGDNESQDKRDTYETFDRLWDEWKYSQACKDRVQKRYRAEIESIGYMRMNEARIRYESEFETRTTKNNQAYSARTWFTGAYKQYLPMFDENGMWKDMGGNLVDEYGKIYE